MEKKKDGKYVICNLYGFSNANESDLDVQLMQLHHSDGV